MTIRKTGKIWLGVGTATMIGASAAPGWTQSPPAHGPTHPTKIKPDAHGAAAADKAGDAGANVARGGEGGEGGEGAAANLDSRVRFFRDMGLIRGHLLVGGELVKAGLWAEALPHFHHPIEELYTWISARLKGQNVRQFDGPLKALAQTVRAKNAAAYEQALKTVQQRMDEAESAMRKFANPYLQFRVRTIMAMLEAAAGEYKQAIEDGKIANPVEYQDSRGFVLEAERMLIASSAELEKKSKAATDATKAAIAELKKAWPEPVPPSTPILDHGGVLAAVSRVELASSPLAAD